jgi:hypothetical protein
MVDINSLMEILFSGLSALAVEDVADGGDAVVVSARTRTWRCRVRCAGRRRRRCTGITTGR